MHCTQTDIIPPLLYNGRNSLNGLHRATAVKQNAGAKLAYIKDIANTRTSSPNINLPPKTREKPRQLRMSSGALGDRNLSIFSPLGGRAIPSTLTGSVLTDVRVVLGTHVSSCVLSRPRTEPERATDSSVDEPQTGTLLLHVLIQHRLQPPRLF